MDTILVESISQNSVLAPASGSAPQSKEQVVAAIKSASIRSGVDFSYLLNEAMAESSLNPTAKAKTSSATGLYQFIDQTWLRTVKESGAKHGLSDMADKIQIGGDGIARVSTHEDRREILALRNDAQVSANMAAELAQSNKRVLERKTEGEVGSTELYMAHFLGAGGASKFLNKMAENPATKAADLFPAAAKANKAVFYDQATGTPRSVSEVYTKFAKKFDHTPQFATATTYADASITPHSHTPISNPVEPLWQSSLRSSYDSSQSPALYGASTQPSESAAFTSMLMAQMDMDIFSLDAKDYVSKIGKYEETQRRSVLSTLAAAA